MSSSSAARAIPRYRSAALSSRLPPAKLPIFRSVVSHPPAPFAVESAQRAAQEVEAGQKEDKKGKGKVRQTSRALSRGELEKLRGDEELWRVAGSSCGVCDHDVRVHSVLLLRNLSLRGRRRQRRRVVPPLSLPLPRRGLVTGRKMTRFRRGSRSS